MTKKENIMVFNNNQNNIYPKVILEKYQESMNEDLLKFRKDTNYFTYEHYSIIGGKQYGDKFEEFIIKEVFSDIDKKDDESHDGKCKGSKGEIKVSRISLSPKNGEHYIDRSVTWDEWKSNPTSRCNTVKFQQIKPYCYDWIIGGITCKDRIRYYLFPTNIINPESGSERQRDGYEIKLQGQHRGSESEGQITYTEDWEKYFIFEDTSDEEYRNIKLEDYLD
jgi:hypothetical protein